MSIEVAARVFLSCLAALWVAGWHSAGRLYRTLPGSRPAYGDGDSTLGRVGRTVSASSGTSPRRGIDQPMRGSEDTRSWAAGPLERGESGLSRGDRGRSVRAHGLQ